MRKLIILLLFAPLFSWGQWSFLIPSDTTSLLVTDYRWDEHVYDSTFWDDMIVSALSLAGGVQAPSLRTIKGGIQGLGFNYQTATDIVYGTCQFSHSRKPETDIEAHFHYTIEAAPSAGDTVVIEFEYIWQDIGDAMPAASDTILCKIPVSDKTAGTHYLYDIGTISGTGMDGLSSILNFRVSRLYNNASDTYDNSNAFWILYDVDFHYEIGKPGSRDELNY